MTKNAPILMFLLIAGLVLTILVVQWFGLEALRAENSALRERVESEKWSASRHRNSNRRSGWESAGFPAGESAEILRLRGEAGVQQVELEKLRAELLARRDSVAALALRTPATTNYYPASAWATAGYGSPEAALQSARWALKEALERNDFHPLLEAVNPELTAAFNTDFAGKPTLDSAQLWAITRAAEAFGQINPGAELDTPADERSFYTYGVEALQGVRVLNKTVDSDEAATLTYLADDGWEMFHRMSFQRIGNEWKMSPLAKP